jgi:hypothetical protein
VKGGKVKHWLLMMKPDNLKKCESGAKKQTRRENKRFLGIRAGDYLFFRSNYKTTCKTASGPYIATEDAKWEYLQDISEEDAKAEGCRDQLEQFGLPCSGSICWYAKYAFMLLWESIYKREGVRWEDNPKVIKISFKLSALE